MSGPKIPPRPPRSQMESMLANLVMASNDDELEVILRIADRIMRVGRAGHGPLNIASETRDMRMEAWEEGADALFYFTVETIKAIRAK